MNQFPILQLNRTAGATINPYRLVTTGSTSSELDLQASGASSPLIGVNGNRAAEFGERFDCGVLGLYPVEYGGDVARGNKLTSDAQGRAVAVTPGSSAQVIGVAWEDGDEGTIGSVLISQFAIVIPGAGSVAVADAGGKFTGTTVEAVLAELKDAIPTTASNIAVADAGGKFTGTTVEAVLAELEARIAAVET